MLLSLYIIFAVLCFIGFSAYKAWKFATMPLHSRLDLYPVPKEEGRAEYGGSYYEETEWWNKSRKVNHINEIKDMLKEILFIKKLFQNQRRLWWASYPFHLGIYFLFSWTILLLISVIWPLPFISTFASFVGFAGFFLAFSGNVLLLLRRLSDSVLRKYTTLQDYFNLVLIFAVLLSGIFVWSGEFSAQETIVQIISFNAYQLGVPVIVHLLLLGLMFFYIPLSKMNHYIGKYFTFHKILWENDPNLPGSRVERELQKNAGYQPKTKWSASHINTIKE